MPVLPESYTVVAYNTAKATENKIHDDAVARRYGFSGGLVPGADVYAYMAHLPVARWGRDFLKHGTIEARFLKPVYDGEATTATAAEAGGGLDIEVRSRGELCVTGRATMSRSPPLALDAFRETAPVATRVPADETSLAVGRCLGIQPLQITAASAAQYLEDVRERDPLYAREGLSHPGLLPRLFNWALTHNVVLGPWMHVASKIGHFDTARVGDELTVRAVVTANYERKGHRFVELDGLVVANGTAPIARVAHAAIYRPRAAAA